MHSRTALVVATALAVAWSGLAFAAFPGTEVYVASFGKGEGVAGSQWNSTLWIQNPSDGWADVQIAFLKRDQPNPTPLTYSDSIPPGETRRYDNATELMFGITGFGALRIKSSQRVIVNSRVFATPAGAYAGDSIGQSFPGIPKELAIGAGESTSLMGVYQTTPLENSEFRYNVGFVECTGNSATVRIAVLDDFGQAVRTVDYPVRGYEARQTKIVDIMPDISGTNFGVRVQVISGAGKVIVFGSGIANRSNDPVTFEMAFMGSTTSGGSISGVTAGRGLTGGGTNGTVTLDVGTGEGITVGDNAVSIANGGVTSAKIATNAVTLEKIDHSGAVNGQYLYFDGSRVVWKTPSSGGGDPGYGGYIVPKTAPNTSGFSMKVEDDVVITTQTAADSSRLVTCRGVVTTADDGTASLNVPDACIGDAETMKIGIELTPIGQACPDLHVVRGQDGAGWEIAGGQPGAEVAWRTEVATGL